jgi:hypothetical protein
MKINRDNYEAYFLDYHEGLLSPDMVQEVLDFVDQNPELKSVLDDFEAVSLLPDQGIVFENKSALKKNQVFATSQVNELNYEEYLIGEMEGLLNAKELAAIEEFISINPQFEKDHKLYALTHLPAENDIVFEAKESLKKKAIPVGLINAETYEAFLARELEGDLNPDELRQLSEFMQYNPHLEQDRKLYRHTILQAETDVVKKKKKGLKQQSVIPMRRIVYYALSAAAALALIFGVYFLLDRNDIPQNLAQQGTPKNIVEKTIGEPKDAIPVNPVAANITQPADALAALQPEIVQPAKNTGTPDKTTASSQYHDLLAYQMRTPIEYLHSRSANVISSRSFVDPQFTFIRVSQMYTNQNMEFYYNLKLAEEIQYAQINATDENPGKTILDAAAQKAEDLFAANRSEPLRDDKKNLSLWTFAELGVQTFNTMTSGDLELNLKKDEEGNVVAYGIESGLLDFEKQVKK